MPSSGFYFHHNEQWANRHTPLRSVKIHTHTHTSAGVNATSGIQLDFCTLVNKRPKLGWGGGHVAWEPLTLPNKEARVSVYLNNISVHFSPFVKSLNLLTGAHTCATHWHNVKVWLKHFSSCTGGRGHVNVEYKTWKEKEKKKKAHSLFFVAILVNRSSNIAPVRNEWKNAVKLSLNFFFLLIMFVFFF